MASILYSEYLTHLERLRKFEKKITTPPFFLMIAAAFFIHLLVLLVWSFVPQAQIFELPVRQMNLKLMAGEEAGKLSKKQSSLPKSKASKAEKTIAKKPKSKPKPKAKTPPKVKPKRVKVEPSTRKASPAPKKIDLPWEKQRVRSRNSSRNRNDSSEIIQNYSSGRNAGWKDVRAHQQKIMKRYEQLISQLIDKHKVYPREAQRKKMQGQVLLRLRIDRAGNIKFISIQKSSGKPLLDQAVIQAARKSNPMPPVPAGYPGGHLLEFIIAVDFVYKR